MLPNWHFLWIASVLSIGRGNRVESWILLKGMIKGLLTCVCMCKMKFKPCGELKITARFQSRVLIEERYISLYSIQRKIKSSRRRCIKK